MMGRGPSFLDSGIKLNGITIILESAKKPVHHTELQEASNIKFKQSFQRYLRWCLDKKFLSVMSFSTRYGKHKYGDRKVNGYYRVYQLTKRGAYLLGLLQ